MAWTQEEIDSVKAAILALVAGQRVAKVSYSGPPARSVDYTPASLGELRAILSEMEAVAPAAVTPGPGYRLASTRKGF
jgi:hypothetical protein